MSVYDFGDNYAERPDAEIHDAHIRNALASSRCIQEREGNASLRQTYHSNEEDLFPGAQSVSTEKLVDWLSQSVSLAKSWMTIKSGYLCDRRRNDCSQKQSQKP